MPSITRETLKKLLSDAIDSLSDEELAQIASPESSEEVINRDRLMRSVYTFVTGNLVICELAKMSRQLTLVIRYIAVIITLTKTIAKSTTWTIVRNRIVEGNSKLESVIVFKWGD